MEKANWERNHRGEYIDQEVKAVDRRIHEIFVRPDQSFIAREDPDEKLEAELLAQLEKIRGRKNNRDEN